MHLLANLFAHESELVWSLFTAAYLNDSVSTTLIDQIWKGATDNTTRFSLFPTIYTPESTYTTSSNPLAK